MIIGLTGSFCTGKTTVAGMFAARGARVIDADRLAHSAIKKGTAAYREIVSVFGRSFLTKSGAIDRKRLGRLVFSGRDRVEKLNSIVHPHVIRRIREIIGRLGKDEIVVLDAPLLIEANLADMADKLVVVKAARKAQLERCGKKLSITGKDAARRIASQIPIKKKLALADFVIDNNGTIAETKKQVARIWEEIWR